MITKSARMRWLADPKGEEWTKYSDWVSFLQQCLYMGFVFRISMYARMHLAMRLKILCELEMLGGRCSTVVFNVGLAESSGKKRGQHHLTWYGL